jgi:Fur family ferric uptake transcriptional regulator
MLEELQKLNTHPTARNLYEIVRNRLPQISLGTIYRNLEYFSSKGIIQKIEFSGSEARFDGHPENHYHVFCTECGKVDDIHDISIDEMKIAPKNANGYDIKAYRINFIGICPDCRNKDE